MGSKDGVLRLSAVPSSEASCGDPRGSSSVTPSSQSSTARNSHSIRPASRASKTPPLLRAQRVFRGTLLLVYFAAAMSAPRKTDSDARWAEGTARWERVRAM
jgi:hypothetical protein